MFAARSQRPVQCWAPALLAMSSARRRRAFPACRRWVDVLRCVSRWELLQQLASGMPTDALIFSGGPGGGGHAAGGGGGGGLGGHGGDRAGGVKAVLKKV